MFWITITRPQRPKRGRTSARISQSGRSAKGVRFKRRKRVTASRRSITTV